MIRNNNNKRNFRGQRGNFSPSARGRSNGIRRANHRFQSSKRQNFDYNSRDESYSTWNEGTNSAHLDEETRNYFSRVLERLQTGFVNEEEQDIFVANVLAQTEGKELLLSCNKLGSQCLQQLLLISDSVPKAVLRFTHAFNSDMYLVSTHHFASHVFESVLKAASKHIRMRKESNAADGDESEYSNFLSWILIVGSFFLENVDDLFHNLYASHVFSSLIQIIGGQNINESVTKSKRSRMYKNELFNESDNSHTVPKSNQNIQSNIDVPEELAQLLKSIIEEFRKKSLPDLCMDKVASPVIQTLLIASSKVQPVLCQKLLKSITKQAVCSSQDGNVSSFLTNQISSHVMEWVITFADDKRKRSVWKRLLKNNLRDIALHPVANYVLQHYHATIQDTEHIEEILNQIGPCFEEILLAHHGGVVASLSETCRRAKTGQAFFTKCVMSAFHCWEPEDRQKDVVPLLVNMIQHEEFSANKSSFQLDHTNNGINLHGSLILQHMLWFNKPNKIANSLLSMSPSDLCFMACDKKGSHIVDAFVQSTYVGENLRDKLVHTLKLELVNILCSRNGSRSMDVIWDVCSLKQKRIIAEELSKKESLVVSDQYGRFFAKKIGLSYFKHRRRDWEQAQTVNNKKRKLFHDIIGEDV